MAKIYVFLADGCEEIEALTPVDLLRRAGEDVCTVSIMGRKEVTGSHKITILADETIEEGEFDDGDMLVLPGGMPGTFAPASFSSNPGKQTAFLSFKMPITPRMLGAAQMAASFFF